MFITACSFSKYNLKPNQNQLYPNIYRSVTKPMLWLYIHESCYKGWRPKQRSFTVATKVWMNSWWARCCRKPPEYRLFAQPFVQAQIQENVKPPRHWSLWRESPPPPPPPPHTHTHTHTHQPTHPHTHTHTLPHTPYHTHTPYHHSCGPTLRPRRNIYVALNLYLINLNHRVISNLYMRTGVHF